MVSKFASSRSSCESPRTPRRPRLQYQLAAGLIEHLPRHGNINEALLNPRTVPKSNAGSRRERAVRPVAKDTILPLLILSRVYVRSSLAENLRPASGSTTHGQKQKGKMVSLATETDRTLFFDFLPLIWNRARFKTRFILYTVPGQVFYEASRKLILKARTAWVFVAGFAGRTAGREF